MDQLFWYKYNKIRIYSKISTLQKSWTHWKWIRKITHDKNISELFDSNIETNKDQQNINQTSKMEVIIKPKETLNKKLQTFERDFKSSQQKANKVGFELSNEFKTSIN